jgi:glycosyltransferase involved in cell wall biosynthesis
MKILILIPHYPPIIGGAEVFAKALADYLAGRGEEVHVITGKIHKTLIAEKDNGEVHLHRVSLIPMKDLVNHSHFYLVTGVPLMFLKSINLVREKDVDIIHTVGLIASVIGTILSKITNKPHVSTIQGWGLSKYSNGNANFLARRLVRYAMSNSVVVHCISSYTERSARELGAGKTLLAPNGAYLGRLSNLNRKGLKEKLGIGQEKIILTAGRLIEIKGIKYLIKAFNKVLEDQNNIRLLIIGDGPEKKKLVNLSDQLHLKDRISFLGHMPHEQVLSYMCASDIFVGPSLVEGLGNVFIEAMACGTPVIGTTVGGIPDIIEDKVNGLLVPPGDSNAIADAILKILNDEELRIRFSKKGLMVVKEIFDWDKICEKIYNEYFHLINGKRAACF